MDFAHQWGVAAESEIFVPASGPKGLEFLGTPLGL
jgi:hypothetical protein